MGFLGFANVYAMRVNLSVAIVAMVNNTAVPDVNVSDVCPAAVVPPDYIPVSAWYSFRSMSD
jgi:MFS transporter, ACS family, solute carrier family 17 (sodium-dependent inorganic phosphate cotransporter), member 5